MRFISGFLTAFDNSFKFGNQLRKVQAISLRHMFQRVKQGLTA